MEKVKWKCPICGLGPVMVPVGLPVYCACQNKAAGPGTELKKLLYSVGIVAEKGCSCDGHAAEMNRQGVEWCAENIATIVGWMREEATKRGLPFIEVAARWMVRKAIRRATAGQ